MNKVGGAGTIRDFIEQEGRLSIELILDGHHVPMNTAREILKTHNSRVVLVSDAMAAAGAADGDYVIGKLPVIVKDRVARLSSNQKLAGSTLTLSQAFVGAIKDCGLTLEEAVKITSTNAAKAFDITDRGTIAVGMRADLLAFDSKNLYVKPVS
jgi:N-acetylglucosamine-6-phosphate deacetylase